MILSLKQSQDYKLLFGSLSNLWKRSFSIRNDQPNPSSSEEDIASDRHSMVLVLIDVINHLDYPENQD